MNDACLEYGVPSDDRAGSGGLHGARGIPVDRGFVRYVPCPAEQGVRGGLVRVGPGRIGRTLNSDGDAAQRIERAHPYPPRRLDTEDASSREGVRRDDAGRALRDLLHVPPGERAEVIVRGRPNLADVRRLARAAREEK